MTTRRLFLTGVGGALVSLSALGRAAAEPHADEAQWIANHMETRLLGSDGNPIAGLPAWTRMRILRGLPNGTLQVWVPRFSLVGRVPISAIGPIPIPTPDELQAELLDGPESLGAIGLPGRTVGGGNLRTWPGAANPLLRTLGHNAPVRALESVVGDDGDEWYRVQWLDGPTNQPIALGYVHNSIVRLPRLRYQPRTPDHTGLPSSYATSSAGRLGGRGSGVVVAAPQGDPLQSHPEWQAPHPVANSQRDHDQRACLPANCARRARWLLPQERALDPVLHQRRR